MNFVLDMNISPSWISIFEAHGHCATHWSEIGSYSAADKEILEWARENHSVVFTNDLDFGAIIAATGAVYPSVIQLRDINITPGKNVEILMNAIKNYREHLERGALISIDSRTSRVRILPIQ